MYELDDVKTFNDGSVVNVTSWIWENVDLPPIQLQSRLKFHGQFDRYVDLNGGKACSIKKCSFNLEMRVSLA